MRIVLNVIIIQFEVFATAQCVIERQLGVVCALVVPVLLEQSFVSILIRLQSSGFLNNSHQDECLYIYVYGKDHGLIIHIHPEDRSLNLIKPRDWILPDPDNESLALVRAVLLSHPDSSQTQTR